LAVEEVSLNRSEAQ